MYYNINCHDKIWHNYIQLKTKSNNKPQILLYQDNNQTQITTENSLCRKTSKNKAYKMTIPKKKICVLQYPIKQKQYYYDIEHSNINPFGFTSVFY